MVTRVLPNRKWHPRRRRCFGEKRNLRRSQRKTKTRKPSWKNGATLRRESWRNGTPGKRSKWKHKKNNRVAEAEFVKERDETTPGNEWERISRLCDFNPKNNKNTKDVSKLRSLLLQLKQNPIARSST